jgi:hypothetical protein
MFGLSASKILLLVLIVGAVFIGTRVLARIGQDKKRRGDAVDAGGTAPARDAAVDLQPCRVCGTFLQPGMQADCGRTGCPHAA